MTRFWVFIVFPLTSLLQRHNYSSPIYNVTVNILEPVTVFDSKSLFIYVLGISIAAIVAFGGSKLFKKLKTVTQRGLC